MRSTSGVADSSPALPSACSAAATPCPRLRRYDEALAAYDLAIAAQTSSCRRVARPRRRTGGPLPLRRSRAPRSTGPSRSSRSLRARMARVAATSSATAAGSRSARRLRQGARARTAARRGVAGATARRSPRSDASATLCRPTTAPARSTADLAYLAASRLTRPECGFATGRISTRSARACLRRLRGGASVIGAADGACDLARLRPIS